VSRCDIQHDCSSGVPASTASLGKLEEFSGTAAERFRLDESVRHDLQLCCEEVFVFLCEGDARQEHGRDVLVRITSEEDTILVELTDRSAIEDVDLPQSPADLGAAGPEDLSHLGLMLVSKLAHDVNHLRISGWNYISFRLMRSTVATGR